MNKRPTRIFIAEWIPSLNKGELSILFGMLKTFDVLGETKVSILSFYPEIDKERYPQNLKIIDAKNNLYVRGSPLKKSRLAIALVSLHAMLQHIFFCVLYTFVGKKATRIMNKSIWKEYCKSDVIIICHDQASCVFGSEPFIFYPIYLTILAKTLDKPIVIYANGTYKLKNRLWKLLARYVLNNVDLTTLREEESFKYLRNIAGNAAPIFLTADPTILLPPIKRNEAERIALREGIDKCDELLIGVTITHSILLSTYPELKDPEERYQKAITAFAKLFDHIINKTSAKIVFLPHCIEPYKRRDDRDVVKEIFNLMQNKHKVVLITKEYSPQELKGLMCVFDLFVGSRIHSVVNALCMNVPSITLTTKNNMRAYGIIGGTFKQKEWICPMEGFRSERLISMIMSLLLLREEVHKKLVLEARSVKEKAQLNGKLLKTLLNSG